MRPAGLIVCLSLLLLSHLLCSCVRTDPPAPGYSGPYPSAKGQAVLRLLQGQVFNDVQGLIGGGAWTVGPFGVVPNPVTGKGPVVLLTQGDRTVYLPVETLGDVADLHRRVTGSDSPLVSGQTGANYRRALGQE